MSVIKWGDKRYWYFVTQRDMGKVMSLNPRTPDGMCDDEPNTKRICVAPTAAHCFSAIGIYSGSPVYVYRTRRQVKARIPYNVGDSSLTKEHWLMTRTRFTQVAVINIPEHGISWEYGDRGCFIHDKISPSQRKDKNAIMSFMRRRDIRLANIEQANTLWRMK